MAPTATHPPALSPIHGGTQTRYKAHEEVKRWRLPELTAELRNRTYDLVLPREQDLIIPTRPRSSDISCFPFEAGPTVTTRTRLRHT
ncbi:hypothetical protein DOTSEDRAFT_74264 [Dothistroma septosporum NZE10]|uniref:Uncharacterized protein n=1 Tax=Dothistroma septosporum (strain NZE10 / CBS 128990) TaxID=675120 RepID=N1PDI7_DOTSN|nr:hypothetical protein DOTSEDRAFT_74264 [Dothistroma septosporum NZE10]